MQEKLDSSLSNKSGPKLVAIYNELAVRNGLPIVQRFASRTEGVRRILATLAAHPDEQRPIGAPGWLGPAIKARLSKRPYRPVRQQLITPLRRGATVEELRLLRPQWDDNQLRRQIRALAWHVGFGVHQDESGKIWLVD